MLDDLYFQLFQYIDTINTQFPNNFQTCSCSSDMECVNFDNQAHAQSCFWYCYSQGLGDVYKLDSDNDGRVCTEFGGNK